MEKSITIRLLKNTMFGDWPVSGPHISEMVRAKMNLKSVEGGLQTGTFLRNSNEISEYQSDFNFFLKSLLKVFVPLGTLWSLFNLKNHKR